MTGMSTDPSPAEPHLPGRLIAFRADRLGARLVSLINAMRLAQDLGADFACAWTETASVGHVFNDPTELFEPDFVAHRFLDAASWRTQQTDCRRLTRALQQDPDGLRATLAAGQDLIVGNAFGILALAGEDGDQVAHRFRAQFDRIPFAAPVAAAMQALVSHGMRFTAYHIRRGDLTCDLKAMNKPWPHKMVPDEFYDAHIARTLRANAAGVLLFSDDPDTIARFKSRHPAVRTLGDLIDLGALSAAQRDLIELYAMSRCAPIIAPGRSAFSSAAADLSGARKVAIAKDLDADERAGALQALVERLRRRPDSFAGPGEIGQSLAHIGPWLADDGRPADAARLFADQVAGGLNISFVYPQTMRYQHQIGDVAGVIETAGQMRGRQIAHIKDQARAEILHGYAHLRQGATATGRRHIVNGVWHCPTVPEARSMVAYLIRTGALGDRDFLPSTPVARGLLTKRGPLKALLQDYPDLATLPGGVPAAIAAIEPVLWDWAPLMRSVSPLAAARGGTLVRFVQAIAALPDDPSTAVDRDSLLALYQAFAGPARTAIDRLRALAGQAPDQAMIQQRLSHALWIARDHDGAAKAAARAADLAPDWPAMRAWAGLMLIRTQAYETAAAHLRAAAQPRLGLASVHALLADALRRLGDRDGALIEMRQALDLAPLEANYAITMAQLLDQAGQPDQAIGHLRPVFLAQRASVRLVLLLISLLHKSGRTDEATEIARRSPSRIADHPSLAGLAKDLAA